MCDALFYTGKISSSGAKSISLRFLCLQISRISAKTEKKDSDREACFPINQLCCDFFANNAYSSGCLATDSNDSVYHLLFSFQNSRMGIRQIIRGLTNEASCDENVSRSAAGSDYNRLPSLKKIGRIIENDTAKMISLVIEIAVDCKCLHERTDRHGQQDYRRSVQQSV